ncbi:MAG: peptide chain release factor N(5)-glutamine methyltransferase, partial [Pseudomonadota bacterium]|nr:peptide chain release factor N(5)-glutamine methyltransferase [Pseudomonadota bacterium]
MLESRLLMSHLLLQDITWMMGHPDTPLSLSQSDTFFALTERRLNGEPLAYITGKMAFYDIELNINPSVLIPRPETECLVELVLSCLDTSQPLSLLDLGTGSGAIALSIAKARPDWKITATDISGDALFLAQHNAKRLGLNQIKFLKSDWFSKLSANEQYDVIVSNPPYIATDDPHLRQLGFEPLLALTSGQDGLDALKTLITQAPPYLRKGGLLICEHGYNQAKACYQLFKSCGYHDIRCTQDLAGI